MKFFFSPRIFNEGWPKISASIVVLVTFCAWQFSLCAQEFRPEITSPEKLKSKTFSIDSHDHGLTIEFNGQPVAEYVIDEINKPYLFPIIGPTGKSMTRAYPMQVLPGEVESQRDHPHHRGITFGHESIVADENLGVDTWHEQRTFDEMATNPRAAADVNKRMARLATIKHIEFIELGANENEAVVMERLDYLDATGKRFLTEQRQLTFRVDDDTRSIDIDQDLTASDGDVRFDDRKDAGLSIRVPTTMAVDVKLGGRIVNSNGETNDGAWSKPAKWCDYHGPVEGEQLGIAFLNHPASFRFPTRWHVRSYGLFTANPFASKSFDGKLPDATTVLKSGESIKLRHRLIFHSGDADAARIDEAWDAYSKEAK